MPRKRNSKKQLELERLKRRTEMQRVFEAECREMKQTAIGLGLRGLFKTNIKDCVERKLREWDDQQLQIPTGRYRDEARLRAEFQQAFMTCIRDDFPFVLEELRKLTGAYDEIWPPKPTQYSEIVEEFIQSEPLPRLDPYIELFDNFKSSPLLQEYFSLISKIEFHLNKDLPISIFFLKSPIRSDLGPSHFRYDNFWGEIDPLLRATLIGQHDGKDELSFLESKLLEWIIDKLVIDLGRLSGRLDREPIERLGHVRASMFVDSLKEASNEFDSAYRASRVFSEYLKQVASGDQLEVATFLRMQISLNAWAKKYNLEKDWVIRYAYHFLSQFSRYEDLEIEKIEVPPLAARSLRGDNFTFEWRGWMAGDETREFFERELRSQFGTAIERYFDQTSRDLNLPNLRAARRPPKLQVSRWAAIAAIRNLRTPKQVADFLEDEVETAGGGPDVPDENTIYHAFKRFADFQLPATF